MMIEDNEFIDLPDDPEEGFAVLQRRLSNELERAYENNNASSWYLERRHVDTLIAYDEVHNLGLLQFLASPPAKDTDFSDFFQIFRRHTELTSQKIRIEAARRHKLNVSSVVVLDKSNRPGLHQLIEAIRQKLNEIDIPDGKRESLFDKLNAFAAEVDRNRTRTEAFFAFTVDVSRTLKDLDANLKPFKELKQTIDRVLDWLDKAKKLKDALPPWSERKKIEAPPKQIENKQPDRKGGGFGGRDHLDDDIPF